MTKRNLLVAVSGGVDSAVLLDILGRSEHRLIVAHVDHGIREVSADDARFVEGLARQYNLPFVSTRCELGPDASEETARQARYDFLMAKAQEFDAEIAVAHHQDDVIGSIVINLVRGTGWRGVAVMNRPGIIRPLIGWTKQQIYDYALTHHLEWVEDETNHSLRYLRNRLRAGIIRLERSRCQEIIHLRARQLTLVRAIDKMTDQLTTVAGSSRYFYSGIDRVSAIELLRKHIDVEIGIRPTIPQTERVLLAVKTAKPGKRLDVGDGVIVSFNTQSFVVARHLR